jgi:hypothetical protein
MTKTRKVKDSGRKSFSKKKLQYDRASGKIQEDKASGK